MERSKALSVLLAIAAIAVACASVASQTVPQPRPVRKADRRPMPFAPGSETVSVAALEYRSDEQMTQQDRDLAAGAEASIGERAGAAGLDFNQGT